MRCPECGSDNLEGARFCSHCSKALPQIVKCPSCAGDIPLESNFCPFCARRLEPGEAAGTAGGSLYKQNDPAPLPPIVAHPAAAAEAEPQDSASDTSGTLFCTVCNEPTPSEQLMYDHEGNRVCRTCMLSGGKKKGPKTRRLEAMKHQLDGTVSEPVGRRHVTKAKAKTTLQMRPDPEPSGGGGGKLLLVGLVVLLIIGGAAGAFYFIVYPDLDLKALFGDSGKGETPVAPDGAPSKGEGSSPEKKPDSSTGKKSPPPPSKGPRWFTGKYTGLAPNGSMVFESPTQETVFIVLPSGNESLAKTYTKGKTYMLIGPIKETY
ncbi:MAG: zinc ribbon domain-containing protein [Planctomycetota bacterium]|jgi:hypothetical protein